MNRPACGAPVKRGGACRAWALPSGRCWTHDPGRGAERHAAYSRGAKLKAINGRRRKLSTAAAVVDFLSGLAYDLAEGRKDAELVHGVAYVLSVQLRAIELSQDSRSRELIAEVEALLERSRQSGWAS